MNHTPDQRGSKVSTDELARWQHAMQLPRNTQLASPTQLQLHFWGTRGSIPVSGPANMRYGGNTSCVSLTSDTGHLFIFDCGSGARELGNYLMSSNWAANATAPNEGVRGYILISHTHWDHIQGFPFFGPVFKAGNHFNIVGWSNSNQSLGEILGGQMEEHYFPVSLKSLPANLDFYSIELGGRAILDGALLTTQLLKHPLPSIAYRLELGGKTLIYATDHEPHNLPKFEGAKLLGDDVIDPKLVKLAANADVLIHDAQYSIEELTEKVGWGHNSAEVAVDTAIKAGVKQLILYHHVPAHDDGMIDELLFRARQRIATLGNHNLTVLAASDGLNVAL